MTLSSVFLVLWTATWGALAGAFAFVAFLFGFAALTQFLTKEPSIGGLGILGLPFFIFGLLFGAFWGAKRGLALVKAEKSWSHFLQIDGLLQWLWVYALAAGALWILFVVWTAGGNSLPKSRLGTLQSPNGAGKAGGALPLADPYADPTLTNEQILDLVIFPGTALPTLRQYTQYQFRLNRIGAMPIAEQSKAAEDLHRSFGLDFSKEDQNTDILIKWRRQTSDKRIQEVFNKYWQTL